ncbi:CHAT domain-containing protein [Nocardia sp. alder85J]|uniref:CHAT domain-containing protein n=1 Tax=Nocardia sp. alder85J TaxID=2862949 RepID=UPI001CD561C9|nr:CHAT domain-containing protein [Nocardia sp. alder85J]MCX4091390.1 CHAT domain-containing protein [Nocardia sp. alder85J]
MSFEQLLNQVAQRVLDFERYGRAELVLHDSALAEAAALAESARPLVPDRPTPEDMRRVLRARRVLGWLYACRFSVTSGDAGLSELARAVIYLEASADDPGMIPESLRAVLGASAQPGDQVTVAARMLQRAGAGSDHVALLQAGVILFGAASAALPGDHPHRAAYLSNLGIAHMRLFERTGAPADADRAIEILEQSVAITPANHPNRMGYLLNLGATYLRRFDAGGAMADADRAIELGRQVVAAIPLRNPDRAPALSNLAGAYRARFRRSGETTDLNGMIATDEQMVGATPFRDPGRPRLLSILGAEYRERFHRDAAAIDLDRSIEALKEAVATASPGDPDRASYLSDLGGGYGARFDRDRLAVDLDRAVDVLTQAVAATPPGHSGYPAYLSNLGNAHRRRFEQTGAPVDLDQAIEIGGRAVTAMPSGHSERMRFLSNLADAHLKRYERSGSVADLGEAISLSKRSAAAFPPDHPDRAGYLSNLGNYYRMRFERTGVAADLDSAIEAGEQASTAALADGSGPPGLLSNLGAAYLRRFERFRVVADLERAIEVDRQALVAALAGHPSRATYLSNLGAAYQSWYERSRVAADLDEAIGTLEQAVAAASPEHPHRPEYLSNLGNAYRERFARGGSAADSDAAVDMLEQAVAAARPNHLNHAMFLSNLAIAYYERLEATGQRVDRHTLRTLADGLASAVSSPVVFRARAGRILGMLANALNEPSLAVELLDAAVALWPSVVPRESDWEDQELRLGEDRGLVEETFAAHCAVDDPVGAVENAEWGRSVLFTAQLDARTDLVELERVLPDLAGRLRTVRESLLVPLAGNRVAAESPSAATELVDDRRRWWSEHDRLLTEIRRHPRFERFLRPPRLTDLRPALTGGAVVVVNAARHRSDAIVLGGAADPVAVRLPDLTHTDVVSQAITLLRAGSDNSLAGVLRWQRELPELLAWLWDTIVHPILDAVPALHGTGGSLPRVWWMPTGTLGLFPLHAAGHPGRPGALDAMISSYTPTLRALAHARTRPAATERRQLTVALHHTPGQPDLPGTVAEATHLHAEHPETRLLADDIATIDGVLAALPEATWAHFACHAGVDLAAPSRSGLRLHDGTLSLPQISRLPLAHAELAYLSACSTAHGSVLHSDESLHPASAFQLAGFRHVVGSLWPLSDLAAAAAATAFYQHLPASPTADRAAPALHRVVRTLRSQHPARPDLWAGLIHSGP